MRWKPHVRFGGRAEETDQSKGRHSASVRSNHFVATALGADGTSIATISARLGHRDKATTLNIYSHALPAADREAADRLGALLVATPAGPSS